jgi:purine-nucleoside phosphorylase
MYKNVSVDEYKRYFSFEDNYSVAGFAIYGAWDVEKYTNEFLQTLTDQGIQFSSRKLQSFLSDVTEFTIGNKKYWFAVCYGSAKLSEYIHLACLLDAQWVLHIGSAGGLSKSVQTLDIVIPDKSVGNDSVSELYKSDHSNTHLKRSLRTYFSEQEISIHGGNSISIQAMMGETFDDVVRWDKDGYTCVDLESSTVMTVSNYFNVPNASMLYISDNLAHKETVLGKSYEDQSKNRTEIKQTIYKALISTIVNPPVNKQGD